MILCGGSEKIKCPVEATIRQSLEFFAVDDAILLAEIYYDSVKSSESLYLLAHCLMRGEKKEAAYKLLSLNVMQTVQLRFLFAQCCYDLNKLQEAETALRMDYSAQLNSDFKDTTVEPFAHALLAKLLSESGRVDEAVKANHCGMETNLLSWSTIKTYCDLGGNDMDAIYKKFSNNINHARAEIKEKKSEVKSVKSVKLFESKMAKEVNFLPKKSRTVATRKTNDSTLSSRRRMDSSAEARRTTRQTPVMQDSENLSTIERTSAHPRVVPFSAGASFRPSQDKQLRSMNRINEMHMNRDIMGRAGTHSTTGTTSEKFMDYEPGNKGAVHKNIFPSSQIVPLSSHNQNTQEKESLIDDSVAPTVTTRSRFNKKTHTGIKHRLSPSPLRCEVRPCTLSSIQNNIAFWTPTFVKIAECMYHMALVQSALSKFNLQSALDELEKMPEYCSRLPLAKELAARVYLEKLNYSKTREILEQLHHEQPHRVSGMEILSTALWHVQDAHRLSTLAAELTENARKCAETWCVAGNCFSLQKQHDTAIECFERAVSLNPHFSYAFSLLGHELLDIDQLDKAAFCFRRALLLCPREYRAWFGLGLMHYKREKLELARIHLNSAIQINPNNSVLLCQLAIVQQALHNETEAMDLLTRALEISPENVACRFYKARLLFELQEYKMCLEELNYLKSFAYDEAQVFFLLGRVHKKLGNLHLALLNFSWAAELDPRGEQNNTNISAPSCDDEFFDNYQSSE